MMPSDHNVFAGDSPRQQLSAETRQTPFFDLHRAHGGKLVEFAGHWLPVSYEGILAEHKAVRQAAGLFDVSHMGQVRLHGPQALAAVNFLLTNDFIHLQPGRVRYSPMCNESGGILDDILVHCVSDEDYWLVVNASNRHSDVAWIRRAVGGICQVSDESDDWAQLALQGPLAEKVLSALIPLEEIPQKIYSFRTDAMVCGIRCLLSRTGYTGEDGFELYCTPQDAAMLWEAVWQAGRPYGLALCGLGARDLLRLEAAMPLYGQEMNVHHTPFESALDRYVVLDKADFIGKAALDVRREPALIRAGLMLNAPGIARHGYPVLHQGVVVGEVTSGTKSPLLNAAIAMAFVPPALTGIGQELAVEIRGKAVPATVVPLPFYRRERK